MYPDGSTILDPAGALCKVVWLLVALLSEIEDGDPEFPDDDGAFDAPELEDIVFAALPALFEGDAAFVELELDPPGRGKDAVGFLPPPTVALILTAISVGESVFPFLPT